MQLQLNKIKILISLVSLLLGSCATKMAFTPAIQKQNSFSESTLKKIQFYTSEEIVLYNSKQDGGVYVENGKILLNSDKEYEKIIIPKNTPCVLEQLVNQDKMILSFEYGNGKILYFTNNNDTYYSLAATEWKSGVGKIKYANKSYYTNAGNVILLVKSKTYNKIRNKQRVVSGRKI